MAFNKPLMVSAAIDTTGDGRANVIYVGADTFGHGIPDALQLESPGQIRPRGVAVPGTVMVPANVADRLENAGSLWSPSLNSPASRKRLESGVLHVDRMVESSNLGSNTFSKATELNDARINSSFHYLDEERRFLAAEVERDQAQRAVQLLQQRLEREGRIRDELQNEMRGGMSQLQLSLTEVVLTMESKVTSMIAVEMASFLDELRQVNVAVTRSSVAEVSKCDGQLSELSSRVDSMQQTLLTALVEHRAEVSNEFDKLHNAVSDTCSQDKSIHIDSVQQSLCAALVELRGDVSNELNKVHSAVLDASSRVKSTHEQTSDMDSLCFQLRAAIQKLNLHDIQDYKNEQDAHFLELHKAVQSSASHSALIEDVVHRALEVQQTWIDKGFDLLCKHFDQSCKDSDGSSHFQQLHALIKDSWSDLNIDLAPVLQAIRANRVELDLRPLHEAINRVELDHKVVLESNVQLLNAILESCSPLQRAHDEHREEMAERFSTVDKCLRQHNIDLKSNFTDLHTGLEHLRSELPSIFQTLEATKSEMSESLRGHLGINFERVQKLFQGLEVDLSPLLRAIKDNSAEGDARLQKAIQEQRSDLESSLAQFQKGISDMSATVDISGHATSILQAIRESRTELDPQLVQRLLQDQLQPLHKAVLDQKEKQSDFLQVQTCLKNHSADMMSTFTAVQKTVNEIRDNVDFSSLHRAIRENGISEHRAEMESHFANLHRLVRDGKEVNLLPIQTWLQDHQSSIDQHFKSLVKILRDDGTQDDSLRILKGVEQIAHGLREFDLNPVLKAVKEANLETHQMLSKVDMDLRSTVDWSIPAKLSEISNQSEMILNNMFQNNKALSESIKAVTSMPSVSKGPELYKLQFEGKR